MDGRTILAAMLAFGLSLGCSVGASAQSVSARAARPTASPAGMAQARRQIAAGELTQALASLEQAILARPLDGEPRLLHASVLCRLDDVSGSQVEFDRLRGWDFPPELWQEATAPCQAMRRGG